VKTLYGVMAELADEKALLAAALEAREAGWERVEAYAPFPVKGLAEAVDARPSRLALFVLLGGILGGASGYFLQWYTAVVSYPINVGGRPLNSWPEFIPVTFEMTVLFAALAAVIGMIVGNGLPRLRHPLFDAPHFDLATRNRFFLCLRSDAPRFDEKRARGFLESLKPMRVIEVAA
jgi:ActD protein